jgi:hypothetical protein
MNLEESDALVGIGFLQMPTTRGRIIRLDADAFAARGSADPAFNGAAGLRRSGWRFNWSQADAGDLNVPFRLSCELVGRER